MKDAIETFDWKKESNDFLIWLKKSLKGLEDEKRYLADKYQNKKGGFVYFLKSSSGNYKLGRSKNTSIRLDQLKGDPEYQIEIVHRVLTDDMPKLENLVHEVFSTHPHRRIEREWFFVDEGHSNYLYFLGIEQFNFWDDYLDELKLIENNISTYSGIIRAYKQGSTEITESIRKQLDNELANRIERFGCNPRLMRTLDDLGQWLVDRERWKEALAIHHKDSSTPSPA